MKEKPIWTFEVYDQDGNNVTDEKEWFVDNNGTLYYLTEDIDSPLVEAEDYWWNPQ